jgi:hypothetical protein
MKIYTQFELQQMQGYDILKNILNEAELQFYFNTPIAERGKLADRIIIRKPQPTFKPQPIHTQKCTSLFNQVSEMAKEHMHNTFTYRGQSYNMWDLGWRFEWSNHKRSYGQCCRKLRRNVNGERFMTNKVIKLSRWLIENSEATFNEWVDTMLHEIAHAIDCERRKDGKSDHSYIWQDIALSIGCNGKRCGSAKVNIESAKYTTICPNGHKYASHKRSKAIELGRKSCGKCSSTFNKDYLLKQIQNY